VWFSEIELITASDLLALLTYHKKCSIAVGPLLANLDWVQSFYGSSSACTWLLHESRTSQKNKPVDFGYPATSSECGCGLSTAAEFKLWRTAPVAWWATYMKETFEMLKDRPSGYNVLAEVEKTIQKVRSKGCSICAAQVKGNMEEFSNLLALKVDEATASVRVSVCKFTKY
jgi:hypothetical protein